MPREKAASGKPAQPVASSRTGGAKPANKKRNGNGDLGFEATLWSAADQLRGSMDASEYKHPVLGLIFLKYIFMPARSRSSPN